MKKIVFNLILAFILVGCVDKADPTPSLQVASFDVYSDLVGTWELTRTLSVGEQFYNIEDSEDWEQWEFTSNGNLYINNINGSESYVWSFKTDLTPHDSAAIDNGLWGVTPILVEGNINYNTFPYEETIFTTDKCEVDTIHFFSRPNRVLFRIK
jgi:hypothetical protein